MRLVRPPIRECAPAAVKLPRRRFGSCSLNGAPLDFWAPIQLSVRFLTVGLIAERDLKVLVAIFNLHMKGSQH